MKPTAPYIEAFKNRPKTANLYGELTRRYSADARVNLLQGDEGRIRSSAGDARLEVLLGGIYSGPNFTAAALKGASCVCVARWLFQLSSRASLCLEAMHNALTHTHTATSVVLASSRAFHTAPPSPPTLSPPHTQLDAAPHALTPTRGRTLRTHRDASEARARAGTPPMARPPQPTSLTHLLA